MNTQLSWLIPLVSGIYLLGIRMVWMFLEQKNVRSRSCHLRERLVLPIKNFVDDCWTTIAKYHSDY